MDKRIKEAYQNIPVPKELEYIVNAAIRNKPSKKTHIVLKSIISIAAALCIVFISSINLNPVFAKALYKVPVLGNVCRIFTFSHINESDITKNVDITIPNIVITGDSTLENRVNLEILKYIQDEKANAEQNAQEYYNAYIETGGDPKEYMPLEVNIDYEIKHISQNYVSFLITKYETRASFYATSKYYNLDIQTQRDMTLKDMLGNDYKEIASKQIQEQIDKFDEEKKLYLFDDINIDDLIDENRKFYIDEDGKTIVIVFEKYEIAAGAAGQLEFPIVH